ncbi:MAG: NERD domain-containing protein [Acidobacteriota bacterium]
MARMIPPAVSPETPSSERRVFEALRLCKGSENWTVLHSLGFSSARTGQFGEIDFLVLIPGLGMICVEVKGGRVTHREGLWYTQARGAAEPEALKRSPFRQAQEGMWKLKHAIESKFGAGSSEARCPIGWIVVLPDVPCPPITTEFVRDEVIDQGDLEQDIALRIARTPSIERLKERIDLHPPAPVACKRILGFLRPDFDLVPMARTDLWDTERRLQSLTEEQYSVLDAIADNAVCLVKGPAGTGKTNIALECARRFSSTGKSVLLACFNRQLGGWLRQKIDGLGPGRVVAGHLHGLLRERIAGTSLAGELPSASDLSSEELYGSRYFELGALAIADLNERFDVVLVDEAQDFDASRLADVIREWTDGICVPRIILFGDFTRQALYGCSQSGHQQVCTLMGNAPVFNVSLNCRNTRRIATQMELMTGFAEVRLSDRQPEGEPVEVFYAQTAEEAAARANQIVTSLRTAGYHAGEVIVLGSRRRENSSLAGINKLGGWRVAELGVATEGDLAYSTVHSFKGLERPVAILVDAGSTDTIETDSLLYVGMSRARVRLFVICPESVKPVIDKRVMDGILAMAGEK